MHRRVLARSRAGVSLDWLLHRQFANQSLIEKHDVRHMRGKDLAEYLRMNVLACTDELHELLAETGWKHWKKGYGTVPVRQRYVEELADVLLFVLNLALAQNVTGEEIVSALDDKISENRDRQRRGY